MDTDNKIIREIYSITSGHYLSKMIPLDYFDWEEERQYEFLEENNWEPFENWEPSDVWNLIDTAAIVTYKWYMKKQEEGSL